MGMTVSLVALSEMTGRDLSVRGLATVDVRDLAGDLGIHSDSSAGVLDGQ
jgi:hypothetical protein